MLHSERPPWKSPPIARHSPFSPTVQLKGALRQLQQAPACWGKVQLCCEPRRLFRRYVTTNPIYVVLIAWQLFKCWILRCKYQRALSANSQAVNDG